VKLQITVRLCGKSGLFLLLLTAFMVAAGPLPLSAADIPCTHDGFYYAVCPIQPELANKRVIDGSDLPPAAPDEPKPVVDGSKLSPLPPQHVHGVATSKSAFPRQVPAVAAISAASIIRKNWRNYTMTDWMSIASIFLLALVVGVVFYLVNRTIQNERRTTAATVAHDKALAEQKIRPNAECGTA